MEKSILNEVKAILKSLVLSSPEKITIEKLNRDYRDVEGEYIPFRKLGCTNIEQFLHSIPDTVKVFGSGLTAMVCFVANEKSDHIHNMIMQQKKPKPKRKPNKSRSSHFYQRSNRFNSPPQEDRKKLGQQLSPFQSVNRHTRMAKTPQIKEVPKYQRTKNFVPPDFALPQPSGIKCVLPQPCGINLNESPRTNYNINHENFNSLLKEQCYVTTPAEEHQARTVKFSPKNDSINGHSNVEETKNQSLEAALTETKNEYFEKSLLATPDVCNEKEPKVTKHAPIKLSKEVQSLLNMRKLRKALNPITEPCTNGSSKYLQEEEMPPLVKNNCWAEINPTKNFFNDSTDRAEDPDEAVPSFAAINNVFRYDFPENTVNYGSKIPQYKLDDDITVGSLIPIIVTEIHSPFKFWFHISKVNDDLDLLMRKIELFYTKLELGHLCIPRTCLVPGQICAALYNNLWHRAEIVAHPVNTTIKVSFIDYGTVTEVNVKHVKFLNSAFAELPVQALRGCLSNIKPLGFHWSRESTEYFLTLVENLVVHAQLTEIDRMQNVFYMVMCSSHNEVIQVNTSLVKKSYALLSEDWKPERIEKNNGGRRIRHPLEDFPT